MRLLISNLLAVVLLFQALTGVCCYHVCNCGKDALVSKSEAAHAHCCHHGHKGHEQEQHQAPSNHPHCLGFCTYVLPTKVQVDCPLLLSAFDSSDTSLMLEQIAGSRTGHFQKLEHSAVEPPLRLHLLHQILLI